MNPTYQYLVKISDVGNVTNRADAVRTILTSTDNIPEDRVEVRHYHEWFTDDRIKLDQACDKLTGNDIGLLISVAGQLRWLDPDKTTVTVTVEVSEDGVVTERATHRTPVVWHDVDDD